MKKTLNIVVGVASALGSMGTSQLAQAAGFNLDFETDASGNALDAIALDTHGANDRTDIGSLVVCGAVSGLTSAPMSVRPWDCFNQTVYHKVVHQTTVLQFLVILRQVMVILT